MPTPLDVRQPRSQGFSLIRDRPRGDGVKGIETDVLYGVAIRPRGDGVIKGLKLTYYMAWKWRGGLTPLLTRCSREASLFNHRIENRPEASLGQNYVRDFTCAGASQQV